MAGVAAAFGRQSLPFAAVVLRFVAALSCLLASICWCRASTAPLLLRPTDHHLHWWSTALIAPGLVAALLLWFAATVRGRRGLLAVIAVLLSLAGGAAAFVVVLAPTANEINPVSSSVPYTVAGFALGGLACLLVVLAVTISGGWGSDRSPRTADRPADRRVLALAGSVSLVLTIGAGLVVVDRSNAYVQAKNEYRSTGDVDKPPGPAPRSALIGGDHWQVSVPGLTRARPTLSAYGIAVAAGETVRLLDRQTGAQRWSYTRSDVQGLVQVASDITGRQILAWWGPDVYVLDARTGKRIGHWRDVRDTTTILEPALSVVSRIEASGQTTVARLNTTGDDRWTYPLEPCESSALGRRAGELVVLEVVKSCGTSTARLLAIDAGSGQQSWSVPLEGSIRAVSDVSVVVLEPPTEASPGSAITAIDLEDGATRWTRQLPQAGDQGSRCQDPVTYTAAQAVMVICEFEVVDAAFVPHYSSVVQIYDTVTGARRQHTFVDSLVGGSVVTEDGRALVARGDWNAGCVLDAVTPTALTAEIVLVPGSIHECSATAVLAFDRQVVVADADRELLRSLR